MPVFSRKWGMKPTAAHRSTNIAFEKPIGSGPYLIERYDNGRTITYKRDPNYWGAAVAGARRHVQLRSASIYRLYSDEHGAARRHSRPASTTCSSNTSRATGCGATSASSSTAAKSSSASSRITTAAGMQGFVINARRPKFQDIRVRKALGLALDFEWLDRQLFYSQYKRIDGYFPNSELQAKGCRRRRNWRCSSRCATSSSRPCSARRRAAEHRPPPGTLRANLRKARELLPKPAGPTATARCATRRASRSCSRFSTTSRRSIAPVAASTAQPAEARHRGQLPHGRLCADPEAHGRLRFRHDERADAGRAGAGHGACSTCFG